MLGCVPGLSHTSSRRVAPVLGLGCVGEEVLFGETDSSLWFRASSVSWLESQAPSGQEMIPGHTADAGRLPSPHSLHLPRRHGDPTRQGPQKRPRPSAREAPCLTSQGAAVRRGTGPFLGPGCPEAALSEGPASTVHSGLFLLGNTGRKIQYFRFIVETHLLGVKKY